MDRKKNFMNDYKFKQIEDDIRLSKTSDNFYYNAIVSNNTSDIIIRASYSDDRVIQILKKPDDYYAAIVRFKLPITSVPIMIFQDNFYYISLAFGGVYYPSFVQYIPHGVSLSGLKTIFTIQHFLDCVNTTLLNLYRLVYTANPLNPQVPPSDDFAPKFIFNSATQLFTLLAYQNFQNTPNNGSPAPSFNAPNPNILNIYMNYNLSDIFYLETIDITNIDITQPQGPRSSLLIIKDNGVNDIIVQNLNNPLPPPISVLPFNFLQIIQETPTTYLLNTFQSIVFLSNSLGTKSESIPGINGSDSQLSIIADFEPIQNITPDRGYLQFINNGPYRYIDFDTNQEIRNIKIDAYWVNNFPVNPPDNSRLVPIFLTPGQIMTIKLLFKKKKVAIEGK